MNTGSKHRVLILDDDVKVRNSLTRLLRRHDFDITTASDGRRALKRLRRGEAFDCMIVDLMMPGIDGKEFVKTLSKEKLYPLSHTLILTAVHHADNATAYMQYGCAGYCGKPWSNERLLDQVTRICDNQAQTDNLEAII